MPEIGKFIKTERIEVPKCWLKSKIALPRVDKNVKQLKLSYIVGVSVK